MARVRNLNYNGGVVEQPVYDGVNLTKWIHNGVVVWENGFSFKGGHLLSRIINDKHIYLGNRNNYTPSTNSYTNCIVSYLGDREDDTQIFRTYAEYNGIIFCLPSTNYGSYTHVLTIYDTSGNLLSNITLTFNTAVNVSCFVTHCNRIVVCPDGGDEITIIKFNAGFTSYTIEYMHVPYFGSSSVENLNIQGVRSQFQRGITEYFTYNRKLFNAKNEEITQITSFENDSTITNRNLALKSPISGWSYFLFTQRHSVSGTMTDNLGIIAISENGTIYRKVLYTWHEVYSGGSYYEAAGEDYYSIQDFAIFPDVPLTQSSNHHCCLYLYLEKRTGTGTYEVGTNPKKQIVVIADSGSNYNLTVSNTYESSGENFNDVRVSYGRSSHRNYTYNDFWNALKQCLSNGFITPNNGTDSGFEYHESSLNYSPHSMCVFAQIGVSYSGSISNLTLRGYNILMAKKYWFNPLISIVSGEDRYSTSNLHVCYYNPDYYDSDSYYEDLS